MGAWIETEAEQAINDYHMSRPAWARGLKHALPAKIKTTTRVAPRVGAWIETKLDPRALLVDTGRAPRGRVD